ncbi:MAG: hypothetical protein WC175_06105 [Candidatus Dojkabacteria bacterium]|jgi:hypothetical protein|nr:hypothetical protein [Candidatus Dojkabacteria bacterium]
MNGYGPVIPATGGGVFSVALVWGIYSHTWVLVFFSVIALAIMIYSFARLLKGEKKLSIK